MKKFTKIVSLCQKILWEKYVPIRIFASLIGLVVHAFNAISEGPMHYRNMERDKIQNLRELNDYDSKMFISNGSVVEIQWWLDNVEKLNGKPIRTPSIDFWIETDASLQGWGATFSNKTLGGRWTLTESKMHINELELLAIKFSLKAFFSGFKNCHIGIKSDNTTSVSYINSMGGMTSKLLNSISIEIWQWCIHRAIVVSAKHIPGIENVQADQLLRQFSDSKEWMLKPDIFSRICHHFFLPDIDLFASRLNTQLDKFVSWTFDPDAAENHAFTLRWFQFCPYIFPPFRLIGRVLNKILSDKVEKAILIVPLWKTQSWFPLLISSLISIPAR